MFENEALLELVPHRGKMFMLSRVLDYDFEDRSLRAEYDGGPSCQFYEPSLGGIPSWVSFEFMAQGIAALSGITDKLAERSRRWGVILHVSNLRIDKPVITGKVGIEVRECDHLDAVFVFDCSVRQGDTLCAHAKITVMEIENMEVLIGNGK
ncbi:MAG: 3-hydroxylacyl-ACP dehydratase [Treponema sp.]|jgi:predicted hotdog family 3-hydroxylacyl-ACP dehydratase|nr:3-hydroxylacyl-ACP dehydratase [Treponema sp.]